MKNTIFPYLSALSILILNLLFCFSSILAQDCQIGSRDVKIHENNIKAKVSNDGRLWSPRQSGGFCPLHYLTENVGSCKMFGAMWIGSKDSKNDIDVSALLYGVGISGLIPGPYNNSNNLPDDDSCENWDKIFVMTSSSQDRFLSDWSDNFQIDDELPLEIAAWPAVGNPFFSQLHGFDLHDASHGLAPFFDNDNDGIYNPMKGDFPNINNASKATWCIMHEPIGWSGSGTSYSQEFETHLMVYAYSGVNESLENSIIYDYKFVNRSTEPMIDTYMTIWIDPDHTTCGLSKIGCIPEENMSFFYDDERTYECSSSTPEHPPILMGLKILEGPKAGRKTDENGNLIHITYNEEPEQIVNLPMSSMMIHSRGISNAPPIQLDPSNTQQYYNYQSGLWLDGSRPIHDGKEVSFLYAGNPSDESEWSMCSEEVEFDDYRMMISCGPFHVPPGGENRLTFAVMGEVVDNYCPDVSSLINKGNDILEHYEENNLSTFTYEINEFKSSVSFSPNPFGEIGKFSIVDTNDLISSVLLTDICGKLIFSFTDVNESEFVLSNDKLVSGIYFYQLKTKNGSQLIGKIIKQ